MRTPFSLFLLLGACGSPVSGAGGASSSSASSAVSSSHATHAHASSSATGGAGGMGGMGGMNGSSSSQMVMQCGMDQSTSVGSSTTTSASTGGFHTAPHPAIPGVSPGSGSVLAHMELVTITFAGDPKKATEEAFGDFVLTSSWYAAVGTEYGVFAGTHLAKATLSDALPAMPGPGDIQVLLAKHIADGALPSPSAPNHDVLYLMYVPDVSIACGFPAIGCHTSAMIPTSGGMTRVYYAVVDDTHYPIDVVTSIASHEIIEAATDPEVGADFIVRGNADACEVVQNYEHQTQFYGEVGDLCEGGSEAQVIEGGFTLQRSWSNQAAQTGDPCVPAPPGSVFMDVGASPSRVQSVPIGSSVVFKLTGWSSGPTPDWKISVDPTQISPFDPNPQLSQATMNNGVVATLTLSPLPPNAKPGDRMVVPIRSTFPDGRTSVWPVEIEAE